MNQFEKELGYFLLRFALGVNLFIHGVIRLGGNYDKFVNTEMDQFAASPLPTWSVDAFVRAIPYAESAIGALLILGLATRFISVVGGLVMVCLIFGIGTLQKWDVASEQMIYVLFYFILLFLIEWNRFSLDQWLGKSARI
jgi:thiosulfate dehydrogenase [quinone] large subunit